MTMLLKKFGSVEIEITKLLLHIWNKLWTTLYFLTDHFAVPVFLNADSGKL
jgi:hypothetical protein